LSLRRWAQRTVDNLLSLQHVNELETGREVVDLTPLIAKEGLRPGR